MPETLEDIVLRHVSQQFPETHLPDGDVNLEKVERKINTMTNVELLECISDALTHKGA